MDLSAGVNKCADPNHTPSCQVPDTNKPETCMYVECLIVALALC